MSRPGDRAQQDSTVRIRAHSHKDLGALIALFQDFYSLHRGFLGRLEPMSEGEAREVTQEALAQPQSWLIVAEDEQAGQVVGFARWEEREGAFFGRELFVHPWYRRRGIGNRLQEEIERRVQQAGGDALFVSLVPHNRQMLAFAHSRGYDTLNTIELRKELAEERPRRDRVSLFDLEFQII